MNTKPIIFQDAMIRALLEGHKTQTRRVVKPQPKGELSRNPSTCFGRDAAAFKKPTPTSQGLYPVRCPYGQPGDLLWVREAWNTNTAGARPGFGIAYRADWPDAESIPVKWRPSIHMPRWASRLTLRLTDVRVERVQDIREGDAEAEGIEPPTAPEATGATYRGAFLERVHSGQSPLSKHGLDAWVWVLEFEVIHKNVVQAVRDLAPEGVAP
jgi:hypothetical protein